MSKKLIHVAHSPDSDDAFMFHALANHKIDVGEFQFEHVLNDIETLNSQALEGRYEVTAVSIHAYAFLTDRYVLLPHGASIGDGYGPRIVARKNMSMDELAECTIAIPGKMTSAFLLLNLLLDKPKYKVIPFDEIIPAVLNGQVDAGLVIHEGQLTYEKAGLYLIKDLGEWWKNQTNLPVPLGGNVIRRDLGEKTISSVSKLLRQSIQYALDHRKEALEYAIQFAGELPYDLTDEFVGMYVNDFTLDYGELGKKAVQELLDRGYENGLIPKHVHAEFSE